MRKRNDTNKILAMGLIIECPFGEESPDCPLKEVRKLPLVQRVATVKEMSDQELDDVVAHHKACLKRREHGG